MTEQTVPERAPEGMLAVRVGSDPWTMIPLDECANCGHTDHINDEVAQETGYYPCMRTECSCDDWQAPEDDDDETDAPCALLAARTGTRTCYCPDDCRCRRVHMGLDHFAPCGCTGSLAPIAPTARPEDD